MHASVFFLNYQNILGRKTEAYAKPLSPLQEVEYFLFYLEMPHELAIPPACC